MEKIRLGIIICDRYRTCAGGKCFKALHNREGAFARYLGKDVVLVGYTTCNGCPGGNMEYTPDEMVKNGAEVIHLATGMLVGYPPCTRINYFKKYLESKYSLQVVLGTHPIPEKYYIEHQKLGTWNTESWQEIIKPLVQNKKECLDYN
ncbi:MAG: metal-binding-like protein [Gracilibacter sp. BRH_c7a]|nr:MAG: metal-binding-like protein [Gracilibacter sp. BRH_c7a]